MDKLSRKHGGNIMVIRVVMIGGDKQPVEVPDGSTVSDALREAQAPVSGVTWAISGTIVGLDRKLADRDTLTGTTKMAGGNLR